MNRKNESLASDQAQRVLRILEEQCGIWNLLVRDIPIWWFVRNRFQIQLLNHFNSGQGEAAPINRGSLFESLSHLLSICCKAMIFGIRSLCGMIQIRLMKLPLLKDPIVFVSVSSAFRGAKKEGFSDIYFDPIRRRISSNSIVIERTTLSKWDFHSLLFRKDALFFDWLLLCALLKLSVNLWEIPTIKRWHILCAKCRAIDFSGISSDHLLDMILSVIDRYSRKAIVQVDASIMLLQRVSPKVIIEICSYDSAPTAINLVARRQGIPIVELQHGYISDTGYGYRLPSGYQGERPVPDKIMVYGEAFKKVILGIGSVFAPENIVVTGFPRLSIFLNRLEREGGAYLRERTRKSLGIAQDTFVVTLTTQLTTSHCLSNFLDEAVRRLEADDVTICIKPHPSEINTWKRSYGDLVQDSRVKVKILIDSDIDLYELLVASDVHATVRSTVFFESLALGVPNIIIGCPGYHHVLDMVDEEEAVFVNDRQTFAGEVAKLARDASYRQGVVRCGLKAAERFFATRDSPVEMIMREIDRC